MPASQTARVQRDLHQLADGSWVAEYGDFTLKSAMQPIFQFQNGQLRPVAFEALLRPQLEDTAVITPMFLDAISDADTHHIETLARTMHVRNAATLPEQARRLFLNFAPTALASDGIFDQMLDDLGRELVKAGMNPTQCICEITEQAAPSRSDLNRFVYALRARGYIIAVDDFGTDHANMERIEALTPDIVKIDGGLVRHLMATPEGYSELKELVAKLRGLRINTVLEGIEEIWQIEMAESAGSEMVQGFAAAVPRIAPANFDEWFKDQEELQLRPLPSRPATG